MNILIYPKCSTCKKAINWLETHGVKVNVRHIVEQPLSKEEIKQLHLQSGEPIKKFFNTSGMKYRELNLKDKIPTMSEEECYELLASDGMLVKRPLAYNDEQVTLGFKRRFTKHHGKNNSGVSDCRLHTVKRNMEARTFSHYISLYTYVWNLSCC